MRKGLSPLIAVVLLIAFTITIAALVAAFSRSFVQERTEGFEEQTQEIVADCNFAGLTIDVVTYDEEADSISILIRNQRTEELTDFRVNVFSSPTNFTTHVPTNSNATLERGAPLSLSVSDISPRPESIEVQSLTCPMPRPEKCVYRAGEFQC